jgi:hypothetical protein
MQKAIEILQHELTYAKGNRAECNENDGFYHGWVKSLECAIGVLVSNKALQQPNTVDVNRCAECGSEVSGTGFTLCEDCVKQLHATD